MSFTKSNVGCDDLSSSINSTVGKYFSRAIVHGVVAVSIYVKRENINQTKQNTQVTGQKKEKEKIYTGYPVK